MPRLSAQPVTPRALYTENRPGIPSFMLSLCPPYPAVNSTPEAESWMSRAVRSALSRSENVSAGHLQRCSMNSAHSSSRFITARPHMEKSRAFAAAYSPIVL